MDGADFYLFHGEMVGRNPFDALDNFGVIHVFYQGKEKVILLSDVMMVDYFGNIEGMSKHIIKIWDNLSDYPENMV